MRLLSVLLSVISSASGLIVCDSFDACAIRQSRYGEREGSGWDPGSGQVPVYDEMFPEPELDYSTVALDKDYPLCECGDGRECSLDDANSTVSLDRTLTLAFCHPVSDFKVCPRTSRSRGQILVIGSPNMQNMRMPDQIVKGTMFCHCAGGYTRVAPEAWGSSDLCFPYKCI